MALKKKTLREKALSNTQVTKGTKNDQKVLKEGTPLEHSVKHLSSNIVGANLGLTKNMDNYESLRVDCWVTDEVREGETPKQAFERILGLLDEVLIATVKSYTDD